MVPTAVLELNTAQIVNHEKLFPSNGFFIVKNKAYISLFQCDFSMIVTLLNKLCFRLHTLHRKGERSYGTD